ncbi:hypothetical protein IV203_031102 [Nitzschia inconspicua]|uniref:Uncharacterized protein n=1 Tax=Nitzschia inconspicua TaxID=303405 RepID=A0A9K3LTM6_9STRA|nr:hypothetical protein IV203_031102 [Nitzschia inconspicua]
MPLNSENKNENLVFAIFAKAVTASRNMEPNIALLSSTAFALIQCLSLMSSSDRNSHRSYKCIGPPSLPISITIQTQPTQRKRVVSRFPTPNKPGSETTLTTRHSYITCSHIVLTEQEFKTGTIPWERWSVRTKPKQPVPTIICAPSMNTTPHGHVLLEAPQALQMPTPATPRHTSWAAVAAGTTTALPPTQPGTASNTSYTEAQIQALIASQEHILEQRLEQRWRKDWHAMTNN